MLAAGRRELPGLVRQRLVSGTCAGRALHAVAVGMDIDAVRAGRVLRISREPEDQHLAVGVGRRLLDRNREINELVRSRRRRAAILLGDVDAIDEDHPQIAVLGRAGGGDIRLPAGWQKCFERRVWHHEIELHAHFRAVLNKSLGGRLPDEPSYPAREQSRRAKSGLPHVRTSPSSLRLRFVPLSKVADGAYNSTMTWVVAWRSRGAGGNGFDQFA